mmetsp:Transcript_1167/g.1910  ORF Transcript_1167/g.1910 Transcript_1167/m.1910 type:complete len:171 (-) Transcript_1167:874-1386(-)
MNKQVKKEKTALNFQIHGLINLFFFRYFSDKMAQLSSVCDSRRPQEVQESDAIPRKKRRLSSIDDNVLSSDKCSLKNETNFTPTDLGDTYIHIMELCYPYVIKEMPEQASTSLHEYGTKHRSHSISNQDHFFSVRVGGELCLSPRLEDALDEVSLKVKKTSPSFHNQDDI